MALRVSEQQSPPRGHSGLQDTVSCDQAPWKAGCPWGASPPRTACSLDVAPPHPQPTGPEGAGGEGLPRLGWDVGTLWPSPSGRDKNGHLAKPRSFLGPGTKRQKLSFQCCQALEPQSSHKEMGPDMASWLPEATL